MNNVQNSYPTYPVVENGEIIIKASAFIVPNKCITVKSFLHPSDAENFRRTLETFVTDNNIALPSLSKDYMDNMKCAQMWILTDTSDNVSSSSIKVIDENGEKKSAHLVDWGEFFPICVLEKYIEGSEDTVTLRGEYDDKPLIIHADIVFEQLPYRYRRFGRFEDTVKSLR